MMLTKDDRDEIVRRLKAIRPVGGCCCDALYLGQCARCHVDAILAILGREHGVSCTKAPHIGAEYMYMHSDNDDTPYGVDDVTYCGRCHAQIGI